MKYYYHYTLVKYVPNIKSTGVYRNHPYFTTTEYHDPEVAGQALGVMAHNIDTVLRFKDDGRFKSAGYVPSTGRFVGGGKQYAHPERPKPIAKRKIWEKTWKFI